MEITIRRADSFKPVSWSGGTSRQLYIFPPQSEYKNRNFLVRLSTATIEVPESEFTSLPGVSRKLLVLSGALSLQHHGYHSAQLGRFDVDSFEGDWQTKSTGVGIDFNLMTTGKSTGTLFAVEVAPGVPFAYVADIHGDQLLVYSFNGMGEVEVGGEKLMLYAGDLLVIAHPNEARLEFNASSDMELVFTHIFL